jgi:hypothetical protein
MKGLTKPMLNSLRFQRTWTVELKQNLNMGELSLIHEDPATHVIHHLVLCVVGNEEDLKKFALLLYHDDWLEGVLMRREEPKQWLGYVDADITILATSHPNVFSLGRYCGAIDGVKSVRK